jgi:hypothetical protein
MKLKWKWSVNGSELGLYTPNGLFTIGYIESFEHEYHYKGESSKGQHYEIWISPRFSEANMPCEETKYASLRDAMRALKETATVLVIGRGYGL